MAIKHQALGLMVVAITSISTAFAYEEFVKDSYIVAFKKPTGTEVPIIDPTNKAN